MSSQTLPERDQLRIISDLISANGFGPTVDSATLAPGRFDPGDPALFMAAVIGGQKPRDLLPLLTPPFRARLSGHDPDAGEYEPPTWADYLREAATARWEWYPWLPSGELTMVGGWQAAGKSFMALRIAAVYVAGWPWPDGTPYDGPTGRVIWAEGEHGQFLNADRANAWSLPLESFLAPVEGMRNFNIHDAQDLEHLNVTAARPDVLLVVVDSLSGIHQGEENKASMSRILSPLADVATCRNKPVLLTHHPGKPPRGHPETAFELRDFRGSGTIVQPCRDAWGVDRPDSQSKNARRLRVVKCNLIRPEDYPELGFTIHDTNLEFTTEVPRPAKSQTKQDRAVDLLRGLLDKGAMQSSVLQASLEKFGGSWNAANRAKNRLGIVVWRQDGVWWWRLPEHVRQDEIPL